MLRLAAFALLVSFASAIEKQVAPCHWSGTYDVAGQSYLHLTCADVPDGSIISYDVSSTNGYDEFSVLVLQDTELIEHLAHNSAFCINTDCSRKDAYGKTGKYVVKSAGSPYHFLVANRGEMASSFEVAISVAAYEVFPAGQLTGAPPPPPANVCQAIEEAIPPFCTISQDCGTIDCDLNVYLDDFDLEIVLDFCDTPLYVSITVNDTDKEVYWNYNASIGSYLIPVPEITVDVPIIGNATLNIALDLYGSQSGVNITVGVEFCTSLLCTPDIEIIEGIFDFTGVPCPTLTPQLAPSDLKMRESVAHLKMESKHASKKLSDFMQA